MARKKKITKEFITLPLSEIHPYPRNPRINDEAVADVMESIRQCENLDPIEIDENNVILSGHTRLEALKELGYTETECLKYTGLTEERKRKYRILANKVSEKAKWDIELLPEELDGLDFEGYDFDFDVFDMEEIPDHFDVEPDENDYFTTKLTFPMSKKKQISAYLNKHKEEIQQEIEERAMNNE